MQGSTGRFAVDPRELAGKRALVTGGTKGMGEAIARRLAAAGATVATTARSPLPHGRQPDLFGGIDVLINNVGGSTAPSGGFAVLDDEEWAAALDINLLAAVRLDRALLPGMIERRSGVIIHISSIQRRMPLYQATLAYAAAKAALTTYTEYVIDGGTVPTV
jgi:NAD(P)-dependent dehydrogenase (short-subunit alcohol dehydrogenase family)